MRIIFCIIILISFPRQVLGQTISGTYICPSKSKIQFINNSYEQKIADCTIAFTTKGTFKIIGDTLTLFPMTIYNDFDKKRARKPIADTTNHIFLQVNRMRKYLIKTDSLVQLKYYTNELRSTWTLVKQTSK
jgi:hypothetical protein